MGTVRGISGKGDLKMDVAERINSLVEELQRKGVKFLLTNGNSVELVFDCETGEPRDPEVRIGREATLEKVARALEKVKQELGDECYA